MLKGFHEKVTVEGMGDYVPETHYLAYVILEDLFLNDARQLIPKLELDSAIVTKLLDEDNFDALLRHVQDVDETAGIFGCLFNYFYRMTIRSSGGEQAAMLILIRIIQFVEQNPRCNADEVHDFLRAIGYDVKLPVVHFCLFVVIRCELIKWDSDRGARNIPPDLQRQRQRRRPGESPGVEDCSAPATST